MLRRSVDGSQHVDMAMCICHDQCAPLADMSARSSTPSVGAMQTSSEFRLELDAAQFPTIPKEFNMRPHADGVQCAYSFSQQGGNIGAHRQAIWIVRSGILYIRKGSKSHSAWKRVHGHCLSVSNLAGQWCFHRC